MNEQTTERMDPSSSAHTGTGSWRGGQPRPRLSWLIVILCFTGTQVQAHQLVHQVCCAPWSLEHHASPWALTCVEAEQPGAQQRSEGLAWLGHQGHHAKEKRRGCLLAVIQHQVLVHQVRDHQGQQLTGALSENTVAASERMDKNEGGGDTGEGAREGQGLPGNEEAEQAGVVGASQQHKQAQAQLEQEEPPHHGVDTPAPAQGQEVEVVEVGSNVGDAWGRERGLSRGAATTSTTAHILTIRNQSWH